MVRVKVVAKANETSTSLEEPSPHPVFARLYTRAVRILDRAGMGRDRDELVAGLSGRVLEIGAGSGSNFAHYPASVSALVAIEPEPYLRVKAASADADVAVHVVAASATQLPLVSASVGAVVVSLVLCSVVDQLATLAEVARVLVDGGELRFYEHVRSPRTREAHLQDRFERLWPRIAGGCHCNRDTEQAIVTAGFSIASIRRFDLRPGGVGLPISPHVIGRAVRARGDRAARGSSTSMSIRRIC
jgi:ubiquinone/menaquinone biosynthesis C-methylase UbiE